MHLFASFQYSLSSPQAVFILLSSLPQSPAGTRDISPLARPRLGPEAETARRSSIFEALSPPDGIKN